MSSIIILSKLNICKIFY